MGKNFKGSCLCGNIRFLVNDFNKEAANCHCSMCRKFHGAAFGTLMGVKGLTWISRKELLQEFVAPNGSVRTFCSQRGSSLGFRAKNAPFKQIELAVAIFDSDIPVTIDSQIYTKYKANWHELQSNLPTFVEGR